MKIGTRLFFGFGTIVILIAALIPFSLWQMSRIQWNCKHITSFNFAKVQEADDAVFEMHAVIECINRIVMLTDHNDQVTEMEKIRLHRDRYKKALVHLTELEATAEGKTIIERTQAKVPPAAAANNKALALALAGKRDEAIFVMTKESAPLLEDLFASFDTIKTWETGQLQMRSRDSAEAYELGRWVTLAGGILVTLVAIVAAWLITRSIMRPLKSVVGILNNIAQGEGDLTRRLDVIGNDELTVMCRDFNAFIQKLHDIVAAMSHDTLQVANVASQIYISSQQALAKINKTASKATTVATAGEEMAATANDIARNCNMAAEAAGSAATNANQGALVFAGTVNVMDSVAVTVGASVQSVCCLGEKSDQIGAIIGTIEDIADQTNLLALNAAIEAARAGDQGRGFAVVADEVRALAVRTTRATSEISEMIRSMQSGTKSAVQNMKVGADKVDGGIVEARRSTQALTSILDGVNSVTEQINQIATAAQEQTATTCEISNNINDINNTIQHAAQGLNDSATQATNLAKVAEELQDKIKSFKTEDSNLLILELAKNDHRLFVGKARAAVEGVIVQDPGTLATHTNCRFGKWYASAGKDACGHLESFSKINVPHERIHLLAKEAITLSNSGDQMKADKMIAEMEGLSHTIITMLDRVKTEARSSG